MTAFLRLASTAALAVAGLSMLSGSAHTAQAAVPKECAALPASLVVSVLGSDPAHVTGPMVIKGACSWHGDSPTCGMRSFSLRVVSGRDVARQFATERNSLIARDDIDGVGQSAFASADPDAFGAAVTIDRLDVLSGNRWSRLTLLGRFNPDITRETMAALARSAGLT